MNFQNKSSREKDTTNLYQHADSPQGVDTATGCSMNMSVTRTDRSDKLIDLWYGFLMETSCHGMKNIRSQARSKVVRTLYGVVVVAALVGLLFTVFGLLSRVTKYNTVTRTEIYVDSNMTFPTVTFCNICPYSFRGKNVSDPLFRLLAKESMFGDRLPDNDLHRPPFSNFLQRSTEDVFDEYLMDLEILYAKYEGRRLRQHHFKTLAGQRGRCQQFNGQDFMSTHGLWLTKTQGRMSGLRMLANIRQDDYGIVDDGTAGLRVHISHKKDFALVDSHGVVILPGTSTRISVKPHKISFLPRPYKSFGSEYCTDADADSPQLIAKMVNSTFYSFEKCQSQCIAFKASMECLCHIPELVIPGLKICTMYEYMYGCYSQASKRIQTDVSTLCDCPRPCTFIHYDLTLSASQFPSRVTRAAIMTFLNETDLNVVKENFLEVQIYFDSPLVWMEKHDPEYTIHSFMSSLGGQLGICLGASLITLMEFWELILRTVIVSVGRLRRSYLNKAVATKEDL